MPNTPAPVLKMTPYGPDDVYAKWSALAHRSVAGGEVSDDHYLQTREVRSVMEKIVAALQEDMRRKNLEIDLNYYLKQRELDIADRLDALKLFYDFGGSADDFIQEFILPVLTDNVRGMKYIELPEAFINVRKWQRLPGDEGIKDVLPLRYADRQKFDFIPMAAGQDSLCMGTFENGLGSKIGFYRMQARGYFITERGYPELALEKVIARLVIRDSDNSKMPPAPTYAYVLEAAAIAGTVNFFQRRAEEDNRNDNSSATRP